MRTYQRLRWTAFLFPSALLACNSIWGIEEGNERVPSEPSDASAEFGGAAGASGQAGAAGSSGQAGAAGTGGGQGGDAGPDQGVPEASTPDGGLPDGAVGCEAGTVTCYTGKPGTEVHPPCKAGKALCTGGVLGDCSGEILPKADELSETPEDDDCNGYLAGEVVHVANYGDAQDQFVNALGERKGIAAIGGGFKGVLDFGVVTLKSNDDPLPANSIGVDDGFVALFNGTGVPKWAAQLGGPGFQSVTGLAFSPQHVYAVGYYDGTLNPGTSDVLPDVNGGDTSGFLAVLEDGTGKPLIAKAVTASKAQFNAVAYDSFKNIVWAVGSRQDASSTKDFLLATFAPSSNFSPKISPYTNTPQDQVALSVAADTNGSVWVTGHHKGTFKAPGGTADVIHPGTAGNSDIFLLRYTAQTDGTPVLGGHWEFAGGASDTTDQVGESVAVSSDGKVALCGWYQGTLKLSPVPLPENNMSRSLFVAVFASNGTLEASTSFAASGVEPSCRVAWDGQDLLLTGRYTGNLKLGGSTPSLGKSNAFVARLSASLDVLWSKFYGHSESTVQGHWGRGIAASGINHDVFLTGFADRKVAVGPTVLAAQNTDIFFAVLDD